MNRNESRRECPVDLLGWYVNGTLPEQERLRVEVHVADCAFCQADIAEWQMMRGAVHRAAAVSPQPSADFLGAFTTHVERAKATAIRPFTGNCCFSTRLASGSDSAYPAGFVVSLGGCPHYWMGHIAAV